MTKPTADYMAALSHISDAWDEVCPLEHQGHINRFAKELRVEEQMDSKNILRLCVGALFNGLAYGNWPVV